MLLVFFVPRAVIHQMTKSKWCQYIVYVPVVVLGRGCQLTDAVTTRSGVALLVVWELYSGTRNHIWYPQPERETESYARRSRDSSSRVGFLTHLGLWEL